MRPQHVKYKSHLPLANISHRLLDALLGAHVNEFLIFGHHTEPRVQEISENVVDDCLQQIVQLWSASELSRASVPLSAALSFPVHLDPVEGLISVGGGLLVDGGGECIAYFERRLLKERFQSGLAEKFLCF